MDETMKTEVSYSEYEGSLIRAMQVVFGPEYDSRERLEEGVRQRLREISDRRGKKYSLGRFEKMLSGEEPLDCSSFAFGASLSSLSQIFPYRSDIYDWENNEILDRHEWNKAVKSALKFLGKPDPEAILNNPEHPDYQATMSFNSNLNLDLDMRLIFYLDGHPDEFTTPVTD